MPKSFSNLTFTESAHIGLDDDTPEVPLKIKRNDNVSLDSNSKAVSIDYNLSGDTAQGGDRLYDALLIDADSTATGGDATNEVRFSGIRSMVEDSGDANDLYGGYFDARNDKTVANDVVANVFGTYSAAYGRHTAGQVKNVVGGYFVGYTDNADSGTNVNTLAGIRAFAIQTADSGKTVDNAYGVYGKVDLAASSNNGTFTNTDGVYGEVEIDDADCTINNARAVRGVIDSNAGTISSAFQFYGQTIPSGTITNNWGIYSTGASKHTLNGDVGINTTSPGGNLHVVGESGSSGQIYLSDVDNGSSTGDSLLINKSGTNAFVYNRDGGQMSFGTNDASNNIVIANTGNVTFSNDINAAQATITSLDLNGSADISANLVVGGNITTSSGNILLTGSSNIQHAQSGGLFDLNASSSKVQLTTNHPQIVFQIDNDHTEPDTEIFQINISTASPAPLKLTSDGLSLNPISNATSDTDKFLVSDSGTIKYRTGAEVRSDIGAGTGNGSVTSVAVTVGTGLDVSGSPITGSGTIDIDLDLSDFTDMTAAMVGSDEFIVLDSSAERRKAANEIGLSIFDNDAGFTTNTGTVTATGGASSGYVAFFDSSTNLATTNKFFFDDTNKRLSINGGTTPSHTLQLGGNGIICTSSSAEIDLEANGDILMGTSSTFKVDGDAGSAGQYLESTGSGLQWSTPSTSQTILNSNFDDATNTTSYQNIPFNYIFESATQSYYHVFACPAAGTVKRITFMHVHGSMTIGQGSTTTQLRVVKNGSTADTSGELTADGGSADGSKIVYEPGTSFANGDRLQFQFSRSQSNLYWRGVAVSIVLEFTHV